MHCKHHGVTPPSLKIKTSVRGPNAVRIIRNTQSMLMNERISQINATIINTKRMISDVDERLFTELPVDVYTEVKTWCKHARESTWKTCETRQRKKFAVLLERSKPLKSASPVSDVNASDTERAKERWVVNKSDRDLSDNELSVLKKGLNFSVVPDSVPTAEFVTGIETACYALGSNSDTSTQLRSDCVRILKDCKLPKSNISKGEKTALRDLKADPSILVLPADKGRATVVLNKETYVEKASELLSDSNTYKTLKRDPTPTYRNQLVQVLQSLRDSGAIDVPTYRRLYPTSPDVPKFYGLPKIHKAALSPPPIVSSCGSLTYNSAKFVADLLAPLVGKSDRHLKNSADLVDKLSGVFVGEDECLVSYDVTALFTSVPVDESVNIIHDLLTSDTTLSARTKLTPQQITDLLTVCLKTTYFVHDGQFYSQCEGAAMGSPVSPIIANLFMEHLETLALSSFHSPPTFYGRYVDDTMVILKRSVVEDFTSHLNSVHPAIKFTVEFEQANKIAMLDTLISRNADGSLAFSVYQKAPTLTNICTSTVINLWNTSWVSYLTLKHRARIHLLHQRFSQPRT
ncbi:uncharacterized protein [Amphiura filiformis]|uniref:uncharacterized protein n=1 Tax=Amphiura filiformis TaxID=82378 RepID=UPI003B21D28D